MSDLQRIEQRTGFLPASLSLRELSGSLRENRGTGYSTINAENDLQAIEQWLEGLTDNTYKSYRKAAYRFLSWCVLVKGICLSDVKLDAWHEFERFLMSPPEDWILKGRPVPFGQPGYRFFRSPLAPDSVALDRVILHGLYSWLVSANYLSANPLALISGRGRKNSGVSQAQPNASEREDLVKRLRASNTHRGKALSSEACKAIADYIKDMPTQGLLAQRKARYMWIFSLLTYTGLRASELVTLSTSSSFFEYKHVPGERRPVITLHVLGKGQKYRRIPCKAELSDHFLTYRYTLGIEDGWVEGEAIPLVLSVNQKQTRERRILRRTYGKKVNVIISTTRKDLAQPLTRQSLYRCLVGLYKKVALATDDAALADELVGKAVHSLRHTFGSNIVDKTSLRVAMELLGHADPATTSLYSHHDDGHLRDAVEGLD